MIKHRMAKKTVFYEDIDVEIGDKIYCTNIDENTDFWSQHITVGKEYIITDLEYKFPDSICVKSDNGKNYMFVPAKFFSNDIKFIRKMKLDKIHKI